MVKKRLDLKMFMWKTVCTVAVLETIAIVEAGSYLVFYYLFFFLSFIVADDVAIVIVINAEMDSIWR